MIFKDPWILILLPIFLPLLFLVHARQKAPALRFPSTDIVSSLGNTWKTRFVRLPFYLRLLAVALFIVALAGPRAVLEESKVKAEGIDIVLALDASGSMAAEDFTLNGKRMNRLEIIKAVVKEFIQARQHDRLGLVAFGGRAYTVSPLTTDYTWLRANLDRVGLEMVEDGTAIGSAIASGVARLKKSNAKSKVIILLTDGINNAGKVNPIAAAQAAKALGIKAYTIGAGTNGYAPFPARDLWGRLVYQKIPVQIDEELLRQIAKLTGGEYFRATDTESLRRVYQQIDQLEKVEIEELMYREYRELFGFFLWGALALALLELVLANTLLLRLP